MPDSRLDHIPHLLKKELDSDTIGRQNFSVK